jgi:hypothetical protein
MASLPRRWRVLGAALASTAAFVLGLSLVWPAAAAPAGMASCEKRVYDRLFFGLATPAGSVSDDDWARFLAEVVTPRFPSGLTVVNADGQWRAQGQRDVTIEHSRVVEIAHDESSETDRHIREVIETYKRHYHQRSVMLTRARVEVCW